MEDELGCFHCGGPVLVVCTVMHARRKVQCDSMFIKQLKTYVEQVPFSFPFFSHGLLGRIVRRSIAIPTCHEFSPSQVKYRD